MGALVRRHCASAQSRQQMPGERRQEQADGDVSLCTPWPPAVCGAGCSSTRGGVCGNLGWIFFSSFLFFSSPILIPGKLLLCGVLQQGVLQIAYLRLKK